MFWKAEVSISKQMYENSWPIICFYRLVGCFPFTVQKCDSKLFLKWSPLLFLYSSTLGIVLILRSLWELTFSYLITNAHFQMSPTDKLTMAFAHIGWIAIYFCGTFLMPCRFLKFFTFIKYINEVDLILKATYVKSEKYLSVLMLGVIGALAVIYCSVNIGIFLNMKYSIWGYFEATGGYYLLYVLSITILYIVRHMVHSVQKRLKVLNLLFETKCFKLENMVVEKGAQSISTSSSKDIATVTQRVSIDCSSSTPRSSDFSFTNLMKVYLKLLDAVDILNGLLGETIMVGILQVFVQSVQPLYFMIERLVRRENFAIFNVIATSVSIVRNLLCSLLIIEPAYACSLEVKTTERLVCNLLSRKMDLKKQREIKSFSLCLSLRQLKLTGCDLFEIDRFLITSMIESAVTFMLLLLQMQDDNL